MVGRELFANDCTSMNTKWILSGLYPPVYKIRLQLVSFVLKIFNVRLAREVRRVQIGNLLKNISDKNARNYHGCTAISRSLSVVSILIVNAFVSFSPRDIASNVIV